MLFHTVKHRIASLILIVTAAASSGLTACTENNSASVPTATPSAQPTKEKPSPMPTSSGMMSYSSMDLGIADADYDLRFIDGMTPHHQGAIAMAEDVLKNSQRPEYLDVREVVANKVPINKA
jgi:uncharacterized protein (DUF305 family)